MLIGLILTLALLGGAPSRSAVAAETTSVSITWSSEDGRYRLTPRPALSWGSDGGRGADVTVNVDADVRHQTVFGQGAVLESSSVWNIAHLSSGKRTQLMDQLFDPTEGNAYDVVRLAMGCPDMCSQSFYTYDDVPAGQTDVALAHFSIQRDLDAGIVSVAKQALAINPDVRFYLSMWSAPAWMKSNSSLIGGGEILPQYYSVLARYQRMAIEAYQARGIPIYAMTPQNEPTVVPQYPSGQWTGAQARDYLKHLGPELRNHGLTTQIWIGDDNPHTLADFDPVILDDPAAAQYVSAVAIHDYAGDDPAVLQDFRLRYPALPIHLTERSYYGVNGERTTAGSHQAGVRRVIDFYRNDLASWTYWITFLDTSGHPNTGPLDAACCSVPFSAPPDALDSYTTNRDYYLYGQFSRYIQRGAVRVGSNQTSADVSNVAFRNPDDSMVVVVANGASSSRSVEIRASDGLIRDRLPALTVATYRWAGGPVRDDPRTGTFRLTNRHHPESVLQGTHEAYLDIAGTSNTAVSPARWNLPEQRWDITSAGGGYYRLTNVAAPATVLQRTGEPYHQWSEVSNLAATPGAWNRDDQLWRIIDVGDGFYRLVNKAGGVLQATDDTYAYGHFSDVYEAAVSPDFWNLPEQQWRLTPVR